MKYDAHKQKAARLWKKKNAAALADPNSAASKKFARRKPPGTDSATNADSLPPDDDDLDDNEVDGDGDEDGSDDDNGDAESGGAKAPTRPRQSKSNLPSNAFRYADDDDAPKQRDLRIDPLTPEEEEQAALEELERQEEERLKRAVVERVRQEEMLRDPSKELMDRSGPEWLLGKGAEGTEKGADGAGGDGFAYMKWDGKPEDYWRVRANGTTGVRMEANSPGGKKKEAMGDSEPGAVRVVKLVKEHTVKESRGGGKGKPARSEREEMNDLDGLLTGDSRNAPTLAAKVPMSMVAPTIKATASSTRDEQDDLDELDALLA
ncbi:hypothetical protein HK101_000717 [Irineochytrium annulatum]|nr:hypothetical protein HK101_000717 [Irineochytrium annulatum]